MWNLWNYIRRTQITEFNIIQMLILWQKLSAKVWWEGKGTIF